MESRNVPIHLIREVRRGLKGGRAWASYIARTRQGGQATVIFSGTVPRPNATGDHVAIRARHTRTASGDWFIFSDAVVSQQVAEKITVPPPLRRANLGIQAATTALKIALEQLERHGAIGAETAHLYASHACDSLASYLQLHNLTGIPAQQFEDDDGDDPDVVSYADWHQQDDVLAA